MYDMGSKETLCIYNALLLMEALWTFHLLWSDEVHIIIGRSKNLFYSWWRQDILVFWCFLKSLWNQRIARNMLEFERNIKKYGSNSRAWLALLCFFWYKILSLQKPRSYEEEGRPKLRVGWTNDFGTQQKEF